ncbi:MAG: single-stranded DNA-binding protein [Gemmatimonadaceae bacterium]
MSRSLNKIMLIGNVGNDPEIRATSNGGKVANLSLATTRTWNGAGGDRQEKTEWHRCVLWNPKGANGSGLADIVERYVKKGDRLYVEGQVEYRQWQDKDGQTKYTTEVIVRELLMLSARGGPGGDGEASTSRPRAASAERSRPAGAPAAAAGGGGDFEDFPGALEDEEDDLPF